MVLRSESDGDRRRGRAALTGLLVLVIAAGIACSNEMSQEDYVGRLLDICGQLDRAVPDFIEPQSGSDVIQATASLRDDVESAADRLAELDPPAVWQDEHEDMLEALDDVAEAADGLETLYVELETGVAFTEVLNERENALSDRIDEGFSSLTSASAADVLGEGHGGEDYDCAIGYHVS